MLIEIDASEVFSPTTKVVHSNGHANAVMYAWDGRELCRYIEYDELRVPVYIPISEMTEHAAYMLKMAAMDNMGAIDATHELELEGTRIVLDLRDRSKFVCVQKHGLCGLAILDGSKVARK